MNKIFLSIGLIAYLLFPAQSYAQDTAEINYSAIESLGLYDDVNDPQFLGAGIYHQSDRSALTYLLKEITQSSWPPMNTAINSLLLTSAEVSTLNNDIPIELGQNLFTLRLNALLKRGLNKQAFDLYSKLSAQSLNEVTSRLGIFAMLFNQEKAKACLDVKILFSQNADRGLWQELNSYCALGQVKDAEFKSTILQRLSHEENFVFVYDVATYESLNFFERSVLTAENVILLPKQNNAYADIPAQHISALLTQTNLTPTQRIFLTAQAVRFGIQDASTLASLLNDAKANTKNLSTDLQNLATIYKQLNKILPSNKSEQINDAYKIASQHNIFLFTPFLPTIDKMDIGSDDFLEIVAKSLPIYLTIRRTLAKRWGKDLTTLSCKDKSCETLRLKLITMYLIMNKSVRNDTREKAINQIQSYLLSSTKLRAMKNIIENIDSGMGNGDKVRIIYENDFDLINNPRYTMPPYIAVKELLRLGQNQNTATALLLSGILLGQIEPKNIYSGTLSDIVSALSDTGLTDLSRDILAQAFLEISNEGE